ncbi:TerB N-terminal domain-containing protein [Nocardiopsis halotolerans]|uniref:TerB N-terminal domain-containing protein n=1 Tax=Nocardiopsis halotolerans TaxID=124252 RepID=UPI0023A96864|nr:TerB N-terminal domain-containing protein [Nocardiopsis halotolerans]
MPSGVPVTVQNVRVNGGLFYVGIIRGQKTDAGEISTVDMSLHVSTDKHSSLKLSDSVPVPYHLHSWPARLVYLRWLNDRNKYVEQNFLLLYLCGLERRVLATLDSSRWPAKELPVLRRETERLLRRHKHHTHFAEKARAFLDLLHHLGAPGRYHVGTGEHPAPGQRTYRSLNPNGYTVHFGTPRPVPSRGAESTSPVAESSTTRVATVAPTASEPITRVTAPAPDPAVADAHRPSTASTGDSDRKEPSSALADDDTPFLDPRRLAEVQADVRNSDALLADLYDDDEDEVTGTHRGLAPSTVLETSPGGTGEEETGTVGATEEDGSVRLAAGPAALLTVLASSTEWPRSVASAEARRLGLMLGAALEAINEYAVDTVDAPLVDEEGQTLFLDEEVLADLPVREFHDDVRESVPPGGPHPDTGSGEAAPVLAGPNSVSTPAPGLPADPSTEQPSVTSPVADGEPTHSASAPRRPEPPRWVGPDERVHIQGRDIDGGLFHLGTPTHTNIAPEAVDPLLAAADSGAAKHMTLTTKVRPYGDLSPEARASHLDWLARGRYGEVGENSLFLFVIGAEKRALVDLAGRPKAGPDLGDLVMGLRELAARYSTLRRFRTRADSLRAVLERMAAAISGDDEAPRPPHAATHAHGVSPHLLHGLGWLAQRGRNVDVEWALSWSMHEPRVQPTLRLRTDPGFHAVFRQLFARRFPDGIVLPSLERRLEWTYTPVHPRIDPVQVPTGDVADYSRYAPALTSLRVLVTDAADEYTRRGFSPSSKTTGNVAETEPEATPAGSSGKTVRPSDPPRHDSEDASGASTGDSDSEESSGRWSHWNTPGTAVKVGGYTVQSGMLYTGHAPDPDLVDNVQWASALDPGLPVEHAATVGDERVAREITSYFELSPRQRGQYLLWLSSGRTKPAPVVFARLFLNGLERRLVEVLRADRTDTPDLAPISRELGKLRDVFVVLPEVVHDVDQLIRLCRYVHQAGSRGSEAPSEHTHVHRSRCPGLGSVRVPLPRTETEQEGSTSPGAREPSEPDAVASGSANSPTVGEEPERSAPPRVPAGTGRIRPDTTPDTAQSTEPARERVSGAEEQTPIDVPSEASSTERLVRAHTLLGLQLALRGTGTGPDVRSALVRHLCHLADLGPEELIRFRLLTHERETPASLADLVAVLAVLPLRDRERAGDLLLESAEAVGDPSARQTALLLWIHRRLGTEGVLRLRLSERGLAPAPAGQADRSVDSEPAPETATVSAPPTVPGLAEPYARLLADLGERRDWKLTDVTRLACWYGLGVLDALDTINEAAWNVDEEEVLVEEDTRVSVNSALLKEMTR